MDATRELIITTCASLARLLLRMQAKLHSAKRRPNGSIEFPATWSTVDLQPASPWLDGMGGMALGGAINRVTLVQAYLLAMAAQPGDVDAYQACLVLQRLSHERQAWSKPVQRLAAQLNVALPPRPADAIFDYGCFREEDLPEIPRR